MKSKKYLVKELYRSMQEISKKYFASVGLIEDCRKNLRLYNEESISFVLNVERAYKALDPIGRSVIDNEFFFGAYQGWWKNYFSRTYFYILKRKYAKQFLMNIGLYV